PLPLPPLPWLPLPLPPLPWLPLPLPPLPWLPLPLPPLPWLPLPLPPLPWLPLPLPPLPWLPLPLPPLPWLPLPLPPRLPLAAPPPRSRRGSRSRCGPRSDGAVDHSRAACAAVPGRVRAGQRGRHPGLVRADPAARGDRAPQRCPPAAAARVRRAGRSRAPRP